jgi:hypothetical protein
MAAKSFRHLIKKPMSSKESLELVRAIPKMSDRVVVLVCGALIDRVLEETILARMTRMKRKYQKEIFEGRGPASGMWAKIRIAFALAIFGPKTFSELEKIREIRNVFAHAAHDVKFSTRRIAKHCSALQLGEKKLPPVFRSLWGSPHDGRGPRDRFVRVSLLLWMMILFSNTPSRPRRAIDGYSRRYLS